MNKFAPQTKMLWHGKKVEEWLREGKTLPVMFEIAPVGYCNATCDWCFFKDRHKNEVVNEAMMINFIIEMHKAGVYTINWTGGGEPTLHKSFADFVYIAYELGLRQGLFTNGYKEVPHQEMLDWIRISLTPEGFKKIIKPEVKFGICLNHIKGHTKEYISLMCAKAKKFGASYFQVRPALIGDYLKQPILPIPNYLKKFETDDFKVYVTEYKYEESVKPRTYDNCYGFSFCPAVDWNGNILVCLYRQELVLGHIRSDAIERIFLDFRERAGIKVDNKCQNCCKNHEINKILSDALNLKDVDFI